jgi:hypothetical protein
MNLWRYLGKGPTLIFGVSTLLATQEGRAVTQFTNSNYPFTFDINDVTSSIDLPIRDQVETVNMTLETMKERLVKAPTDETVEPLTLNVGAGDTQIHAMAEKIALASQKQPLIAYLKRKLSSSPSAALTSVGPARLVTLDKAGFSLIDPAKFAAMYSKPQHNLILDSTPLKGNLKLQKQFLRELVPFFPKAERTAIKAKISNGEALDVNTALLPAFPRQMLKKYVVFRGPNCFHAALAFQSTILPSSSFINVKEEPGYHRAMINYDELWRAIKRDFYEIDPLRQPLKYGDMLVFFDVPERESDLPNAHVDFRWIRHTATHLFSGYTFSKGSKSPNTPYTVRTLPEEWSTWKRFTKNLALRVYRRSLSKVSAKPPMDLADWVY